MLESINQDLVSAIERARKSLGSMPEETSIQNRPQAANLVNCGLDNVNCPICGNTGYVLPSGQPCECMKKRRSLRTLKQSGMSENIERCSFDNYETPNAQTKKVKEKAMAFVTSDARGFLITGQSGAGKTHICSAICRYFHEKNYVFRYIVWRNTATELKSMVNDTKEYREAINQLRNVPILYIDDFLKGTISDADINLAFTIINDRYNRKDSKTIISTELSANKLVEIDEAVGGRILEMSKNYIVQAPTTNWRLS